MSWYGGYPRYVTVTERRANAMKHVEKLRKQGKTIEPVEISGRTIARSFWGKGWCDHLESFSDFSNRLPRGRTYARNGSVCHLAVKSGVIEAMVSGSEIYNVSIRVTELKTSIWHDIKQRCAGQVGSMLELLQGKLSDRVMAVVADRDAGLFPKPGQIELECSCPDWATMCKHVAAVLYGVGNRLDTRPDLLFTLRGVDPQELIAADLTLPDNASTGAQTLADDQLGDVFGIEFDDTDNTGDFIASDAINLTGAPSPTSPSSRKARAQPKVQSAKPRSKPKLRPTGKSVAKLRRQADMTQTQFAERLGVSPASVTRWESTDGRLKLQQRCLEALVDVKLELERRS